MSGKPFLADMINSLIQGLEASDVDRLVRIGRRKYLGELQPLEAAYVGARHRTRVLDRLKGLLVRRTTKAKREPVIKTETMCSFGRCERDARVRGMCSGHFQRWNNPGKKAKPAVGAV